MPGKKYECGGCKRMMRSDNLKKHEKICKRKEIMGYPTRHQTIPQEHGDIVGDIINNIAPYTLTKKPVVKIKKTLPSNASVKPKSSAIQIESAQTDSEEVDSLSEDGSESEGENMEIDREVKVNYPAKLQKSFRNLYTKFNDDISNLHLLLSELERINFLSSKDCKVICEHFKKKIDGL